MMNQAASLAAAEAELVLSRMGFRRFERVAMMKGAWKSVRNEKGAKKSTRSA